MALIDPELMARFRLPGKCEWCGENCKHGRDPHHIFSKGAGRVDIPCNLISLCRTCHDAFHMGSIGRTAILEKVGNREGLTPDTIRKTVFKVRRDTLREKRRANALSKDRGDCLSTGQDGRGVETDQAGD